MSDFDEPAYPQFMPDAWNKPRITGGLTIRQQAVLMMAQAMVQAGMLDRTPHFKDAARGRLADDACEMADAVLKMEEETR